MIPLVPPFATPGRVRAARRSAVAAGLLVAVLALLYLPTTASAVIFRPFECNLKKADVVGTEGDDVLQGTSRDDVIVALGGNDRVAGGGGEDRICGGDGDDTLDGGPRHDRLNGDDGDDTLLGEQGDDWSDGGEGSDTLVEPANDRESNALQGGPGVDDIEGGRGEDFINGDDDGDSIAGAGGNDEIDGADGDDELDGGPGADKLEGDAGEDIIRGAGGADERLAGGDEDDVVEGGPGDDRYVFGVGGNDVLDGEGGDDRLVGGDGSDELEGGPGRDELLAGAGIDDCGGGEGRDQCDGGAPSPSNPENDPDVCADDVEKKRDCREGEGAYPAQWTGTVESEQTSDGVTTTFRFTGLVFQRQPTEGDGAEYVLVNGSGHWTSSGMDGECTVSGSGSFSGFNGELILFGGGPPEIYSWRLYPNEVPMQVGEYTKQCPPPHPPSASGSFPQYWVAHAAGGQRSDPNTLAGTATSGNTTTTWSFARGEN